MSLIHRLTSAKINFQEPPVATVDHAHQRSHQHQNLWQAMTLRKPNQERFPNHPDADILDYTNRYVVEVEVPGIKDVSKLKIQWLDRQTLLVKGETEREEQRASIANGTENRASKVNENAESKVHLPYLVIGERRLGSFERRFTFPAASVEQDGVKARLEAGLLTLTIPKHHLHVATGRKSVTIETGE